MENQPFSYLYSITIFCYALLFKSNSPAYDAKWVFLINIHNMHSNNHDLTFFLNCPHVTGKKVQISPSTPFFPDPFFL